MHQHMLIGFNVHLSITAVTYAGSQRLWHSYNIEG